MSNPPKDLSLREAFNIQCEFSEKVVRKGTLPSKLNLIGGLDSAYHGTEAFSAAVVLDFETMEPRECAVAKSNVSFPYIPGLLAFREAPSLIAVAKQLKRTVDVFLVDGHGYAHPRRFGLACHVGLALDKPVIGVAKNLLIGTIKGSLIVDVGETIGALISSRSGRNLYISVGHKISLKEAVRIVSRCLLNSTPEPVRHAHLEANRLRRKCP